MSCSGWRVYDTKLHTQSAHTYLCTSTWLTVPPTLQEHCDPLDLWKDSYISFPFFPISLYLTDYCASCPRLRTKMFYCRHTHLSLWWWNLQISFSQIVLNFFCAYIYIKPGNVTTWTNRFTVSTVIWMCPFTSCPALEEWSDASRALIGPQKTSGPTRHEPAAALQARPEPDPPQQFRPEPEYKTRIFTVKKYVWYNTFF